MRRRHRYHWTCERRFCGVASIGTVSQLKSIGWWMRRQRFVLDGILPRATFAPRGGSSEARHSRAWLVSPIDRSRLVDEILDELRLELDSDRRQIGAEIEKVSDLALMALARKLYPSQREPLKVICVRCAQTERELLEKATKPKKKRRGGGS